MNPDFIDFRALCRELVEEINLMVGPNSLGDRHWNDDLINLAIDALAEPLPTPKNEKLPND